MKTQRRFQFLLLLLLSFLLVAMNLPARTFSAASDTAVQRSANHVGTVSSAARRPYASGQTSPSALAYPDYAVDRSTTDQNWWNAGWDYRVPITFLANGTKRFDRPAEVPVNFTALFATLGVAGALDTNSIRVVEIDAGANVIDENVAFQFDKDSGFDAATNAKGKLVVILKGVTNSDAQRRYHLYFDVTGKGFTAPSVPAQVTVSTITDSYEGGTKTFESFKFETTNATYIYHKTGGGFAKAIDKNGNDWISYNTAAGSAGDFRGIPNLVYPADGGYFHPGRTSVTSTLVSQGPVKVTVRSKTPDDSWITLWEIYPNSARLTVQQAATKYWFLYEGTPGGVLEVGTDFVVRSNGTQTLASELWSGDLAAPEWVYFSDPNVNRSLYVAHHTDDAAVDSYRPMDDKMTIFGFGRESSGRFLSVVPNTFTFGLTNGTEFNATAEKISSAYKDLGWSVGDPVRRDTAQQTYTLTVQVTSGQGQVIVQPVKNAYNHGELVTLTAQPATGWSFAAWGGGLGTKPTIQITMTRNTTVTASFSQNQYQLTVNADPQQGDVTVDGSKNWGTFVYDQQVLLKAIPEPGWEFANWSDGLGTNPEIAITIKGDTTLSAFFSEASYTVSKQVSGEGSIKVTPERAGGYRYGELVSFEAIPADGWRFAHWEGSLAGFEPAQQLVITGDAAVTAVFEPNGYETFLAMIRG